MEGASEQQGIEQAHISRTTTPKPADLTRNAHWAGPRRPHNCSKLGTYKAHSLAMLKCEFGSMGRWPMSRTPVNPSGWDSYGPKALMGGSFFCGEIYEIDKTLYLWQLLTTTKKRHECQHGKRVAGIHRQLCRSHNAAQRVQTPAAVSRREFWIMT